MVERRAPEDDLALVFDLGKRRFVKISFEQMRHYADRLAARITRERIRPSSIIYIQRGGMVIARLLSDALGVRGMHCISASYYSRNNVPSSKLRIGSMPRFSASGHVLLVDDIADTGKTLKAVCKAIKARTGAGVSICTFGMKPKSVVKPDFYAFTVSNSTWVIFEYEEHETRRNFVRAGNAAGARFMGKHFRHEPRQA